MTKITFSIMATLLLTACTINSFSEEYQPVSDPMFVDSGNAFVTTQPVMLPQQAPEIIVVQSGGNVVEPIPQQQIIEEPKKEAKSQQRAAAKKKKVNALKEPSGDSYMDVQAEKLRKELLTTGVQIKREANKILIILPAKIAFGGNQTTLEPKFEPKLAFIAKTIKEYDRTKIRIVGYTDDAGSVTENKEFSLRRANSVFNFLRLNGVNINRIVIDGMGPENPIASNKTTSGREQNNRVEISLINMQ